MKYRYICDEAYHDQLIVYIGWVVVNSGNEMSMERERLKIQAMLARSEVCESCRYPCYAVVLVSDCD